MKRNRKQITALKEVCNMYGHSNFSSEGSFFTNHSTGEDQYAFK